MQRKKQSGEIHLFAVRFGPDFAVEFLGTPRVLCGSAGGFRSTRTRTRRCPVCREGANAAIAGC